MEDTSDDGALFFLYFIVGLIAVVALLGSIIWVFSGEWSGLGHNKEGKRRYIKTVPPLNYIYKFPIYIGGSLCLLFGMSVVFLIIGVLIVVLGFVMFLSSIRFEYGEEDL